MITYDTAVVIMIRDPMLTALDTATPVINCKERRKEGDGGVCVGEYEGEEGDYEDVSEALNLTSSFRNRSSGLSLSAMCNRV